MSAEERIADLHRELLAREARLTAIEAELSQTCRRLEEHEMRVARLQRANRELTEQLHMARAAA